jgi:hypothetical protein
MAFELHTRDEGAPAVYGDHATFTIEPSGVLVIIDLQGDTRATYSPAHWTAVMEDRNKPSSRRY